MKRHPLRILAAAFFSASTLFAQTPPPVLELGGPQFQNWTGLAVKNGEATLEVPGEAVFRCPDGAQFWFDSYGVEFEVHMEGDRPLQLDVTLLRQKGGPKDERAGTAHTVLAGTGWHTVSLPWEAFDFRQHFRDFLQEVAGLELSAKWEDGGGATGPIALRSPRVVRGEPVSLRAEVRGKAVPSGATATYTVEVGNPTNQPQGVTLAFEDSGYAAMTPSVSPSSLLLKPGETKTVTVSVEVPARIPAGGHETQTLRATGNGRSPKADTIEFITASVVPVPRILHTQEGWDEVRAKIAKYDWAKAALEDYAKRAEGWNVPKVANQNDPKRGDWLFATQEENNLMASGIAYQGTLDPKYAEKAKTFLLRLSDPKNGYPVTRRACNHASVQEGHFFQHVVMSYDMTLPSGLYSPADRQQIDDTLRLFIGPDASLGDQVSNWTVSYLCGQLYASLALGDLVSAERFLYAPHGLIDQLVKGTLDDGWWYELSISYNTWVASEFSQVAIALQPWGYDLANARFPANYRSGTETPPEKEEYGMSKAQWGPVHHNTMNIKRMWDVLPKMVDYRGVLFGLNDSGEQRVAGYRNEVAAKPLELAYYLYRDPAYAAVIRKSGESRDLLYGVPELPGDAADPSAESAYADNAGVAVLRSTSEGKEPRERIQAVLRYGDHGWYHGHFDRTDMVHLSRYGRSFFNPEVIWYGYPNYMYKFYVQTSVAHNMVVVDQKMQEPAPSERLLFHSGPMLQASAVQTTARWSNPPYGGIKFDDKPDLTFAEKALSEGRSIPIPPDAPPYAKFGSVTDYTEPVLQRRLMLVTDDYVVLADYLKAGKEHTFDLLFQMRGFQGLEAAGKTLLRHDGQWSADPLSSAQFVTDADWWKVTAPAVSRWKFVWGPGAENPGVLDPGVMNMDLHTLWPAQQELMIAAAPETVAPSRRVSFAVRGDGKVLQEGETGTWILGEAHIDVPLAGVKALELETQTGNTNPGSLFWAGVEVVTADGREIPLAQLPLSSDNAQQPREKGKDFEGGPIKIAGIEYDDAVSAQPQDGKKPAVVRVDLAGVDAVRLKGVMGGDFPLGDESPRRKIEAVRLQGKEAQFLTLIEPFEDQRMVKRATATDAGTLRVELADGRVQEIEIGGLTQPDGKGLSVKITETKDGKVLRSETTTGSDAR